MNYHSTDDRRTVYFDNYRWLCKGFYFNLCFLFHFDNGKYRFAGITTKSFIRQHFME